MYPSNLRPGSFAQEDDSMSGLDSPNTDEESYHSQKEDEFIKSAKKFKKEVQKHQTEFQNILFKISSRSKELWETWRDNEDLEKPERGTTAHELWATNGVGSFNHKNDIQNRFDDARNVRDLLRRHREVLEVNQDDLAFLKDINDMRRLRYWGESLDTKVQDLSWSNFELLVLRGVLRATEGELKATEERLKHTEEELENTKEELSCMKEN